MTGRIFKFVFKVVLIILCISLFLIVLFSPAVYLFIFKTLSAINPEIAEITELVFVISINIAWVLFLISCNYFMKIQYSDNRKCSGNINNINSNPPMAKPKQTKKADLEALRKENEQLKALLQKHGLSIEGHDV